MWAPHRPPWAILLDPNVWEPFVVENPSHGFRTAQLVVAAEGQVGSFAALGVDLFSTVSVLGKGWTPEGRGSFKPLFC